MEAPVCPQADSAEKGLLASGGSIAPFSVRPQRKLSWVACPLGKYDTNSEPQGRGGGHPTEESDSEQE